MLLFFLKHFLTLLLRYSKVLAVSSEQLAAAQREISVMAQLHHPNLLPVLTHAVVQGQKEGRLLQLVYMLFPVYEASTPSHSETFKFVVWVANALEHLSHVLRLRDVGLSRKGLCLMK